jgi:hypothetical protein
MALPQGVAGLTGEDDTPFLAEKLEGKWGEVAEIVDSQLVSLRKETDTVCWVVWAEG